MGLEGRKRTESKKTDKKQKVLTSLVLVGFSQWSQFLPILVINPYSNTARVGASQV